jgi:GNAT superfamily N-acetyltransferase
VIRREVSVELADITPAEARAAAEAHHLTLDWSGDSFMADRWLEGSHRRVLVDGEPVGVLGWDPEDSCLSLLTLERRALALDRQVMETALAQTGCRAAYVASWDAHHIGALGAFATRIRSHAYQFRVLDPGDLVDPVPRLELRSASPDDLAWLDSTGFQSDFTRHLQHNALSIAVLDGVEVGIAMHVPHALDPSVVDIGMYVDPVLRRRGVGRSILALSARAALAEGLTPVAGCWWRNWSSRATLEAAGLTCAGTIFRLDLDPDAFAP